MKQISQSTERRIVIQDVEAKKIYFQEGKFKEESLLMSDLVKVECKLSKGVIVQEIYGKYIFSWLSADGKIYDFSNRELKLANDLSVDNVAFNSDLTKFYSEKVNPTDNSYYTVCYASKNFNQLFEMPVELFARALIYFEDKIILVNELGTKLFFYENETLLFTKYLPLYYEISPLPNSNPNRTNQAFKFISKYEHQLICYVNWDRIISIDINIGDILWELLEKDVQGYDSTRMTFFSLFAYATAVDNIIHVLHSSYIQIDVKTRQAKVLYDLTKNNLNIVGLYAACPTFHKNKFYFLAMIEADRQNTCNKFAVFNIDTLTLEQVIEVEIPKGCFLSGNPIVDEKYVYIADNEQRLYIYERE